MQKKRIPLFLFKSLRLFTLMIYFLLLASYLSPFFHPETFIILAFIGLAYPLIFVTNIVLIIIWFFIDKKWSLVSLFIIILGGSIHLRSFALTLVEPEMKANSFKLMSYNVRLFDVYNPSIESAKISRNKIFNLIKTEDPDILCLQEYYRQDTKEPFVTLDSLLVILNSKFYTEKCSYNSTGKQHFGIATFSKYPIIDQGVVDINFSSEPSFNFCIFSDIIKANDTIRIYNVHLQSIKLFNDYNNSLGDEFSARNSLSKLKNAFVKRADQAMEIANHAQNSPFPSVICGDFNDTPLSYTYNLFSRKFIDAFSNTSIGVGSTYLGFLPAGRIDYIFHSKDLFSNNFEIKEEKISDHSAISCIISY